MRTQLLSHNKIAYQKVMKALATSDRTCVVHPTGTGKSYLIAAVSESYSKVLILGPNTFVLDQVHHVLEWRDSDMHQGTVEYMTYSLLMYKDELPKGYDLICLDEFHRAGAPEWGDAVDRLLEVNPSAKVLGTTATPVRFLDDNRDMADELFNGNIASYMTLKEAWDRNILAVPRFVTGLFEFDKVAADAEERISKSRHINADEKRRRITRINNLRLDWERSQGMPQIIRKHIDSNAKRIIVFCGNVEHMKDMEMTVREWFRRAGIMVAEVYNVHAYLPDKDLKAAMEGFGTDTKEGVKLMLSVNMLNEGVHIPRVNAVILLRTTSSKIIYLQQIGRCLTADKNDKPIILDMVDNITTTNIVHEIRENYDWYEHQKLKEGKEGDCKPTDFVVYDYTLGIRQAIDKLMPIDYRKIPFEQRLAFVTAFAEREGRLPTQGDEKEVFMHWNSLRSYYADRDEIKDLKNRYGKIKDYEFRLERLVRFVESHDRLPIKGQEKDEYANFFALRQRNKATPDPRVQAIIDKYVRKSISDEELLQTLLAFVEKNGRLPDSTVGSPKEELSLRRHVRERLMDNPTVKALWEKYSKCRVIDFDSRMRQLMAFVEKHDRLPNRTERDEYNCLSQLRRLNKKHNDADLNAILGKYSKTYTDGQVKQRILDFFADNGRLPIKGRDKDEAALAKLFRDHRDPLYSDPDIIPLLETRKKQMPLEERIRILEEYTAKHGQRPSPTETTLYNIWLRTVIRHDSDPRVKALYERYGGKPSSRMKEYIKPLADYIHTYHHLPSTTKSKEECHLYAILVNLRKNHAEHPDVVPLLDEIASFPQSGDRLRAENDKEVKDRISAFVTKHNRLPRKDGGKEEGELARQWTARRDRLCMDDAEMQAISDLYDKRPMKYEERYETVRAWIIANGRLPRTTDTDIYWRFDTLRRSYRNHPEVQSLLEMYGSRPARWTVDVEARLNEIEAFADEHGRLPSSSRSGEYRLARWWVSIKRYHGMQQRVIDLKERYPIQNRK